MYTKIMLFYGGFRFFVLIFIAQRHFSLAFRGILPFCLVNNPASGNLAVNNTAANFSVNFEPFAAPDPTTSVVDNEIKWNARHFDWKKMKFFEPLLLKLFSLITDDPDILGYLTKIATTIVWVNILLSLLGTLGIDTKPLLSLLSISGLTFGFAAKDFITDVLAGVLILILRPFKRGDSITVGGCKGTVLSIDLKYVKVATADRTVCLIPITTVYKDVIRIHK